MTLLCYITRAHSIFGSTISITSKSSIRYEGVFENFDETTLMLSNVKSFGTEDRLVKKKVDPISKVYKFIRFKGDDIAEINLVHLKEEEFVDPAILSAEVLDEIEQEEAIESMPQITKKPSETTESMTPSKYSTKIELAPRNTRQPSTSIESLTPNTKKSSIATESRTKFYKPFELTNKSSVQMSTQNITSDKKSPQLPKVPVVVSPNYKKIPKSKSSTTTDIVRQQQQQQDSFEASSDNCAQYVFSKPKPPKKNQNILTMQVKEFNFDNSGDDVISKETTSPTTTNNDTASFKKSPIIDSQFGDNDDDGGGGSRVKSSYNANNSFFDKLSYEGEKRDKIQFFSKNSRYSNNSHRKQQNPSYSNRHGGGNKPTVKVFDKYCQMNKSTAANDTTTTGKSQKPSTTH